MTVRDLTSRRPEVLSTDPTETARTLVRLRSTTTNLGQEVYTFGTRDPLDGVHKEAVLTLADLEALVERIEVLQASLGQALAERNGALNDLANEVEKRDDAIEAAHERGRLAGLQS